MNRDDKLHKVVGSLVNAIRLAANSKSRTRRMSYKTIPYDNVLVYKGVKLAEIMVPKVPDDPAAGAAAFDAWAYCLIEGEYDPFEAIEPYLGSEVGKWLRKWSEWGDRTVMLLWALGMGEGAFCVYNRDTISVEVGDMRYGVCGGIVTSKFCDGKELALGNTFRLLQEAHVVRTFSHKLVCLYREAYAVGQQETNALLALTTAYPELNLWKLVTQLDTRRYPSTTTMRRFERLVIKSKDPMAELFRALVPMWMTRGEFTKAVGNLARRREMTSAPARQNMITRLYQYFYKVKDANSNANP